MTLTLFLSKNAHTTKKKSLKNKDKTHQQKYLCRQRCTHWHFPEIRHIDGLYHAGQCVFFLHPLCSLLIAHRVICNNQSNSRHSFHFTRGKQRLSLRMQGGAVCVCATLLCACVIGCVCVCVCLHMQQVRVHSLNACVCVCQWMLRCMMGSIIRQ